MNAAGDAPATVACPVSGEVTAADETSVTITSDGGGGIAPVPGHPRAPWDMTASELFALFASTGCSLLIPDVALTLEICANVRRVIVNAVHNLPTGQMFDPSIFGEASLAGDGLRVLAALFPNAETAVAVNRRNAAFFDAPPIRDQAAVRIMSDKYPQEHPEQLARTIDGGRLVTETGDRDPSILVIAYTDLIQIAETMTLGRPLVDRIVLVAGPGAAHPAWYRIRTGTPFGTIRKQLLKADEYGPWRVIRGDLFLGVAVEDSESLHPADREITVIREAVRREMFRFLMPGFDMDAYPKSTMGSLIPLLPKKLDSGVHGGGRYCVQCNYCDTVCPADIYPHLIWKNVDADNVDAAFRLRPQDCIGCRLCDYVCPSRIDISSGIGKAKAALYKARSEK